MIYNTDVNNVVEKLKKNVLPKINNPDDHEINRHYFKEIKLGALRCFDVVINLIADTKFKLLLLNDTGKYVEFIKNCLVLAGEYHDSSYLWCDERCVKSSKEVVDQLCRIYKCTTMTQLLTEISFGEGKTENNMAMLLLKLLRPKLLRDTWRTYPGGIACYKWIIMNIEIPYMHRYIYAVIPTTLNIMDDYRVSNKTLGLQCLAHILRNLTPEQINQYCSIVLFYDSIKSLIFWREEEIIIPLISCLIEIFKKISSKYENELVDPSWCEYLDETLHILLPIIEFEQNVNLQKKYIEGLFIIMQSPNVNLSIARWSHRLIGIIECYAQFPHTTLRAMQVTELYVEKCFPVLHKYGRKLAVTCGKVVYSRTDDKTYELACRCYAILYEVLSKSISLPLLDEIINRKETVLNR